MQSCVWGQERQAVAGEAGELGLGICVPGATAGFEQ